MLPRCAGCQSPETHSRLCRDVRGLNPRTIPGPRPLRVSAGGPSGTGRAAARPHHVDDARTF